MNRTCRSVDASSSSASTKERWLQTNSAPPFSGMLSRPHDADAVNRTRQHPQHQPQQRVGQQPDRVNRRGERQHRADQENIARRQVQHPRADVMRRRRQKHAHERKQVRRGQHRAFRLLGGPVLQQRANRHDEKPAGETEQRQPHRRLRERNSRHGSSLTTTRPGPARRSEPGRIRFFRRRDSPRPRLPVPMPSASATLSRPILVSFKCSTSAP